MNAFNYELKTYAGDVIHKGSIPTDATGKGIVELDSIFLLAYKEILEHHHDKVVFFAMDLESPKKKILLEDLQGNKIPYPRDFHYFYLTGDLSRHLHLEWSVECQKDISA